VVEQLDLREAERVIEHIPRDRRTAGDFRDLSSTTFGMLWLADS